MRRRIVPVRYAPATIDQTIAMSAPSNQTLRFCGTRCGLLFAGLALLGMLFGCVPTVSKPPPAHTDGGVDPRLVGTWLSGDDDPGFVFIGKGKGGLMRAAIAKVLKSGQIEVDDFELYRAQSGNGNLLMVADDDANPGKRRYLVVRYRFDGDSRLEITWLSPRRVKAAIEGGEIEGRVAKGGWADDVDITAPHEVAVNWFESNPQIWDTKHPISLKRIDDAKLRCLASGRNCPP